jgi:IstB-like ATP binding protein
MRAMAPELLVVAKTQRWSLEASLPAGAQTAVSLLDRLLHHSIVVVTRGESFRMRESKTRRTGRAPVKPKGVVAASTS